MITRRTFTTLLAGMAGVAAAPRRLSEHSRYWLLEPWVRMSIARPGGSRPVPSPCLGQALVAPQRHGALTMAISSPSTGRHTGLRPHAAHARSATSEAEDASGRPDARRHGWSPSHAARSGGHHALLCSGPTPVPRSPCVWRLRPGLQASARWLPCALARGGTAPGLLPEAHGAAGARGRWTARTLRSPGP